MRRYNSVDQKLHRGMIGSLLYLTVSRLFLCLCVHFQSEPRERHLIFVKRNFRYLQATTNIGLFYKKSKDYKLVRFYDAKTQDVSLPGMDFLLLG